MSEKQKKRIIAKKPNLKEIEIIIQKLDEALLSDGSDIELYAKNFGVVYKKFGKILTLHNKSSRKKNLKDIYWYQKFRVFHEYFGNLIDTSKHPQNESEQKHIDYLWDCNNLAYSALQECGNLFSEIDEVYANYLKRVLEANSRLNQLTDFLRQK